VAPKGQMSLENLHVWKKIPQSVTDTSTSNETVDSSATKRASRLIIGTDGDNYVAEPSTE